MTLNAYPVKLEDGEVRTLDGSPLPEQAFAVLVILPGPPTSVTPEAWREPFATFLTAWKNSPSAHNLEALSDAELNTLVHRARRAQ